MPADQDPLYPRHASGSLPTVSATGNERSCNRHGDCAAAEMLAAKEGRPKRYGGRRLVHCSVDDCEDCFGY